MTDRDKEVVIKRKGKEIITVKGKKLVKKFCPHCGSPIEGKICEMCGSKINK